MALVLDWQKKLGYKRDPFIDEPTKDLVGLPSIREKINLFLLKEQKLGLIDGDPGMGKTSFTLWLEKELRGKRRVLEIPKEVTSAEKLEEFLLRSSQNIIKRLPFYDKLYEQMTNEQRTKDVKHKELLDRLQKPLLLVIQDANKLAPAQVNLLNELLSTTKLEVLLLDVKVKNPFSMKHGLNVTLNYTDEDLAAMLRQRIEAAGSVGTFPFDNQELKKLCKKAGGNPRKLLAEARDRAVELSLKNLALPEKPKAIEVASTKEGTKDKSFSLFGNIKFEVVDEDKNEKPPKAPPKKQQKAQHSKKEEHELTDESLEDAELLKKIVNEGL